MDWLTVAARRFAKGPRDEGTPLTLAEKTRVTEELRRMNAPLPYRWIESENEGHVTTIPRTDPLPEGWLERPDRDNVTRKD